MTLEVKSDRLSSILKGFESAIVAFSGGVDSAYLAYAAKEALGNRLLCVTAESPSYPDRHREIALRIARDFSLPHELIQTDEVSRPDYRANPVNRCYFCKHELYTRLSELAHVRGFSVVLDGNNADDRGDYRPGRQAAAEFGVRSPLDEADLTKAEIRELSRRAQLPTWNEPASACLSSRIPYHTEVTEERLGMIEQAEAVLHERGFASCRVRHHDDVARIELEPDDLHLMLDEEIRQAIVTELKRIGYRYVTLDLQGYRVGSLNEALRILPIRQSRS